MEKTDELTIKQKLFVEQYIYDWNGTRAYKEAYKTTNDETAKVNASRLLTNANIQKYIETCQKDLERIAGVSRLMVLNEHMKLAFSSIAHLHDTWITRKEFENLTDDQKACIMEISTQVKHFTNMDGDMPVPYEVEYVKIKLYDKQKALESIAKILGYNEAEKIDLSIEKNKGRVISLFPTDDEFKEATE